MVAAIDIHKTVFHAATLDPGSGEASEERFAAERERLDDWAMRHRGRVGVVAIEATTGWRWVARELQRHGFEVRLVDPGQASALQGRRRRRLKTDRLDARWLVLLLARELLPQAWLAPEEIQRLRDQTRLRKSLVDERHRWAQRLHALLVQEGWPCQRARLLTAQGRRWCQALPLPEPARAYAESVLRVIEILDGELAPLEAELRRLGLSDSLCRRGLS
jgi:transposase